MTQSRPKPYYVGVLVGQTGLGFNPLSSIAKGAGAVANTVVKVARDPRTQNVAHVAAQSYAPAEYAQVRSKVNQVQQILRPPGQQRPAMQPVQQMMPMVDPDSGLPPTRDSHLLLYAGIGAGVLLVVMLMKR